MDCALFHEINVHSSGYRVIIIVMRFVKPFLLGDGHCVLHCSLYFNGSLCSTALIARYQVFVKNPRDSYRPTEIMMPHEVPIANLNEYPNDEL